MTLLAGTLYDPTTAVTKATSAALAMTAVDTTNLRLTFTAPTTGKVLVRLACAVKGATTSPAMFLGVLDGATVRGRVAPLLATAGSQAATSLVTAVAEFVITGLTAGTSYTWDAAYGVETGVTSSTITYGGPNDTTASNAAGGFAFEVWSA